MDASCVDGELVVERDQADRVLLRPEPMIHFCSTTPFPKCHNAMGWFWDSAKNDPIKKLDPGLRQYLEQESPDKYVPAGVKPAPKPSAPESSPLLDHASQPPTPSASLYPDGRYAHLWTTYKPPVDVDESDGVRGASKVIEKYKERGDTVQRAAMENCALEHEALTYCFQTGNWRKQIEARLTMCSAENGTFTRCFQTQSVSATAWTDMVTRLTADRNSSRP